MEKFRDTKKTQRQASPIQDLILSIMRHDHMHMENGYLVEDTPPREEQLSRVVDGIVQAMHLPITPERAIDTVLYRARNLEEAGELPESITSWDVYNHFIDDGEEQMRLAKEANRILREYDEQE